MASVSPLRAFGAPRARHPFEGKVDTRRRRKLKDIARELPKAPGVYFFYGFKDRLLYIGKAKCLRQRVRSYFGETKLKRPPKLRRLLAEITRLEIRECGSELEALLVERRLIAELRPILNRQHKRFEVYPYLLLSDEEFPRLTLTRAEPVASAEWEDEAPDEFELPHLETRPFPGELPGLYLGPFTSPRAAFWTMEAVRNIFPLRSCEGAMKPNPTARACFYHDIGRCGGPCVGAISQQEYSSVCEELLQLLRTGDAPPLQRLRARMTNLAAQWNFEEAAKIKEQLDAIDTVAARLRRLERMRAENNVVIIQAGLSNSEHSASLFLVQGGVVRRHLTIGDWKADEKVLRQTLREVYDAPPPVAPFTGKSELDEMMILDRWLRAHGDEACCVWQNNRSRCWTATTARRLQVWTKGEGAT